MSNIISLSHNRRFILCYSLFTSFLYLYFNSGWLQHPDSYDYIQGLEALKNGSEWYDDDIAFRPGIIYFSFPFTFFLNNTNSLGLQNIILYLFFGQVFYSFSKYITKDSQVSLWSTLLLITSFPVAYWGLSILNDLGGWFFLILSILFILKLFEDNLSNYYLFMSSLTVGIGFIYKPTVLPSAIFFTLFLYLNARKYGYSKSISSWLKFTAIALLPVLLNTLFIQYYWGYDFLTIIDKEIFGKSNPSSLEGVKFTYYYKFLTILIAFPFLPLFFVTRKYLYTELKKYELEIIFYIFISCALFTGFISLRTASPRYTFLLFSPLYILLGTIFKRLNNYLTDNRDKNFFLHFTISFMILINIAVVRYQNLIRESIGLWANNV